MPEDTQPESPLQPRVHGLPLSSEHYGKCFSCGFLRLETPVRAGTEDREIQWAVRWGMENCFDRIQTDKEHSVQPIPICIVGFSDLQDEIGKQAHTEKVDFEEAARIVFKKDRKCPRWYPYSPGKSVQQYYMESFMQELGRLRQQQIEDREKARQALEERLARYNKDTQLELAKRAEITQTE